MVYIISITLIVVNISVIAMSLNLVFHNRSKHIEIELHFIRACWEKKKMELDFMRLENQLAHLFTKAFRRL